MFVVPPECEMCNNLGGIQIAYCDTNHVPSFQEARHDRVYLNITAYGDAPNPHMHCSCRRCGYEWVIPLAKDDE